MALWTIHPSETHRAVTEIQYWKKFDYTLTREETYDWAEFEVNSDTEPVVNLNNEYRYLVNHDPEYSWSLTQLVQTRPEPSIEWKFSENMSLGLIENLKNLIEQSSYVGLDADGWELVNTDFWFQGPISVAQSTNAPEGE
jgi:hypothetical protein